MEEGIEIGERMKRGNRNRRKNGGGDRNKRKNGERE